MSAPSPAPTSPATSHRPSLAARRFGYALSAAINVAVLWVLNVWPGWEELPFLTPEAEQVVGLVNLSLAVGIVVDAVYVVDDSAVVKAVGGLLTTAVGLVVLVRIWQVWPLDVVSPSVDATTWVRVLLIVAIVGSAVGLVVQTVALVRALAAGGRHRAGPRPA